MPYDERLAERIRDLLAGEADVTEQKMFGGLSFLVAGNLAVVASGRGPLMVRVGPDAGPGLVGEGVAPVAMGARTMKGWLDVDLAKVARRPQLERWVGRGVAFARTLPPK
ncbi:MAG: TfoX/Sxy family protein [Acidimicrobiales bacterium]